MKSEPVLQNAKDESVLKELIQRHPELYAIKDDIMDASNAIISGLRRGGKLLICGNGGSASDSAHIAGELMKSFEQKRPLDEKLATRLSEKFGERGKYLAEKLQRGLPVISLAAHDSLITAVANDVDPVLIFAQQVIAYGDERDVLLAISTSGNSRNVIDAIIVAKALGLTVIGLTGESGGNMKSLCDFIIRVQETRTCYVQELHLPVYHAICMIIENYFVNNPSIEKKQDEVFKK